MGPNYYPKHDFLLSVHAIQYLTAHCLGVSPQHYSPHSVMTITICSIVHGEALFHNFFGSYGLFLEI